jgi:hypothetical protein
MNDQYVAKTARKHSRQAQTIMIDRNQSFTILFVFLIGGAVFVISHEQS